MTKYIWEDKKDIQKIPVEDYKGKNVHHEQNEISTLCHLVFSKSPPFQQWNQHLPSFKNQNFETVLENYKPQRFAKIYRSRIIGNHEKIWNSKLIFNFRRSFSLNELMIFIFRIVWKRFSKIFVHSIVIFIRWNKVIEGISENGYFLKDKIKICSIGSSSSNQKCVFFFVSKLFGYVWF